MVAIGFETSCAGPSTGLVPDISVCPISFGGLTRGTCTNGRFFDRGAGDDDF